MSKHQARLVEVGPEQAGRRLDNFLATLLRTAPKSFIYRIIRRGEVRVNGSRAKPDRKLAAADVVRVPPMHTDDDGARPLNEAKLALVADAVLFEDDTMLVIDKPAGIAVHGGSGLRFGVIDLVRELRPEAPAVELVHRLDRDTSGCLVIAKDYRSLRFLQAELNDPATQKVYAALLDGVLKERDIVVDSPLSTTRRGGEKRTQVDPRGKTALTRFSVVETFAGMTLVDAEITTGRTHQIRVHAEAIGHPVVGDSKYGPRTRVAAHRATGLKRMFLHARAVSLRSPAGGGRRTFEAPLPDDLERCLDRLRRS